jgi:hypothetical protein
MTKLLDKAIEAIRSLPADRQDAAGELLLAFMEQHRGRYQLSPEQIEDVRLAIAEADRGDFASPDEMGAFWQKSGL